MHGHDQQHVDAEARRQRHAGYDRRPDARAWSAAADARPGVLDRGGILRLQRSVGNAGTSVLLAEERSPVLDVISSGDGKAMEGPVRAEMEARLGHQFGDVRVHTGEAADSSARAVNAHAYTVGSDVVFQRGAYNPASAAGATLLAHELTHVVQQRNGPVDGTPAAGGIRVSDPADRYECEAAATAERAMTVPAPAAAAPVEPAAGGVLQREAVDAPEEVEEEAVAQGAFVQRDTAEVDDTEE